MTTAKQLLSAKRAEPFRPFTVHFKDGERLTVGHSDCFILGHRGRTLVQSTRDDRLRLIDVSLIENLTPRGKPRRKRS